MIQYLQSWFPGWGGWYGNTQDLDTPEELLPSPSSWDILAETEDLFDPLEDSHTLNTFTRRDHMFARLEFLLEKGGVTLFHEERRANTMYESGVIQLEFSVKVMVESLPRSESSLLSVKLGSLFLRDLTTQGTMFPFLVSPKMDKVVVALNQSMSQHSTATCDAEWTSPVFEMIYERNPVRCKFERRLEVNTSPLNIIYNPQAMKKVTEFFYKGRVHTSFGYQSELELRVAEAARRQYDKLKKQTKAEIRQTIDQLLVGEFIENCKRWTMKLDICAPQVVFPDNFQSEDPMLVVVDLGRILLTNSQEEEEELSDDEYKTPLATPPESPPPEADVPLKAHFKNPELPSLRSPEAARAYSKKLYEKYRLSFKDLQIMVGRYKDSWKHLQESEVGPTHVVEKFNVLLQLEQRLRYTSDPQLPGAVLSATLPDLKVHINLEKMTAIRTCLARLCRPGESGDGGGGGGSDATTTPDPPTLRHDKIFHRVDSSWKLQDSAKNLTQSVTTLEQHTREVLVESRLLLAEFNINYMQLGVESNGRYISVFKVFGTNAHFVKRPYDVEVSLTVHGFLLVDTLQTYGSDFDLLVASHKHLSFDVPTGSLRESQPSSPALGDDGVSERPGSASDLSPFSSFLKDQDALIRLEYQFVSSDCPSMNLDNSLQVTSIQVNNLDIILNPETMVELLNFLQKSFPKEESAPSAQECPAQLSSEEEEEENRAYQVTYDQNKEVTVEIHRLNLLLLRTVSSGTALGVEKRGLKIATASISDTKVNVSLRSHLDISGSLGSMQLLDLTQEAGRSQFVVSIGSVGGGGGSSSPEGLPFPSAGGRESPSDALSFQLKEKSHGECSLKLQMASLHYNHSAKFLRELSLSANELEDGFRSMLKNAATTVSTVLASKTAEYSGRVSLFETPSRRTRAAAQSWSYSFDNEEDVSMEEPESALDTFFVKLTLNISIDSPVVSVPRRPGHQELLVGHLGSIAIQNFLSDEDSHGERLEVLVKDIRLYSVNMCYSVSRRMPREEGADGFSPSHNGNVSKDESRFTRHDFFESLNRGEFHILKDTTILFTLEKIPVEEEFILLATEEAFKSSGQLRIEGKFVNPVQVHSLTLILNKKLHELARASVSKLSAHVDMQGDLRVKGSLGSLSLSDLTPHGDLYRERFTTQGGEALVFNVFYGRPDPDLQRDCDVKVSLQMASVQYVHTQRFQAEVVAFIQHFTQLQDVLGRQRAAMEGQAVRDQPQRASRVLLDIDAGAPVLIIPESSRSPRVIVANLGQLKVQNLFLPAGARGTFSLRDKQVFLCKPVYEQVLQTLDNLSLIEEHYLTPSQPPTPPPPTPSSVRPHCFPDPQGGLFARDPPSISFSPSSLSSPLSLQPHRPPLQPPSFTQLKVTLHVAELQVQLSADLSQGSQGLVCVRFQDLEGHFTKDHPHLLEVQLALRALLMEDLLDLNPDSKYKHLMKSHGAPKPSTFSSKEYLSQSCPSRSNALSPDMPHSLPAYIKETQNVFQPYQRHPTTPSSSRKSKKDPDCPNTPPPSPTRHAHSPLPPSNFDDSLVHINVVLVDPGHPEFNTRHGGVGRSVDVDFNCLDILVTLQTWVVFLDFFSIGSTANNHAVKAAVSPQPVPEHNVYEPDLSEEEEEAAAAQTVNTKVDLKVCLLDCMALDLQEMDIFAAERLPCRPWDSTGKPEPSDLVFPSYSVRRTGDNLLRDCCRLTLKVERNLDFDFMKSKVLFESSSDGSKSVNLVSHSLLAYDTRYAGTSKSPEGVRRNVFDCILQPSKTGTNRASLQLELHYSTRDSSSFTVVLNNLRVFLIFDWLQLVQDFLRLQPENASDGAESRQHCPSNAGASLSATGAVMPKTVKSGVVTKRSTVLVTHDRSLEVKINVTFVVVEDLSCLDTNAVVLKGTTVLTYKPRLVDRPFSGSLAGIELQVFSCRLGSEQETALSIIDPVNVQVELCGSPTYQSSSGLLDAFNVEDIPPLLEIQFPALDIRLSYNDIQLFLSIAKSMSAIQLSHLQNLGFKKEDCKKALSHQLDQAATWLLENSESTAGHPRGRADSGSSSHSCPLSGVEVKADSVCICFIDDCLDCDIPLAELTFSLYVLQRIGSTQEGNASFTLSGDYYNRELSWEPFIEPWPCFLSWQQQAAGRLHPPRLKVGVRAKQRLDVNITSVLLQYNTTKTSWIADYCKTDRQTPTSSPPLPWLGSSVDPPGFGQAPLAHLRTRSTASLTCLEQQIHSRVKISKRRQPFVPYALRNHTGCTMWFATLTTSPTVALSHSSSVDSISDMQSSGTDDTHNVSQWREVLPGEEIPFEFEAREKLRHHTHELKLHQLLVRVCGWEQVKPVSVDKVGVFFRYAAPDRNSSSNTVGSPISRTNIIHPHVYFSALPPVRVVFAITMEGSARKVITVRSALMVKNRLDVQMEVRLDSPSAPDPVVLPPVLPGQSLAVPLHLTTWRLQARPKGMGLFFCKVPIHWTSVERPGEVNSSKRDCQSADFDDSQKRNFFCVVIKKENFPEQQPAKRQVSGGAQQIYRQPGHTIYLLPTMVLANLLPCDLNFYIKGTSIKGSLKPGKEAVLHSADTYQNMELVLLENFPVCKELLIPPGTQNYVVRMRLYDTNKRLLCLTIRILLRAQGALKILVSAPYWLVNKTLPLIFRQDNSKADAAGQFEEHELARSLSPILFCYTDKEQPACTMRIGKGIHPDGVPGWCQGFSLDGGSGVRAVKVIQHGNKPGLIYNIISVRKGKGNYRDTHIVTFAPRYLLDNHSTHKLAFAQREFARGKGASNPEGYLSTLPGSSVVFHWPRNDYDQLLCVRLMDVPNCTWSGGFEVNKPKSFHVNMDTLGKCFFLRTEISLKEATYQISFTDTDQLPPPLRIDNMSEVPIQFWQHGVADLRLHTEVKAASVLDYACDEPTLPPYITLTVKGAGSSEVTADMNNFREYNKLYYENFIYIAATHTFPEPGKRSQLWRMTGTGMLCHEGSSPPQSKPAQPRPLDTSLVLDIAGLAAVSDNFEPLMLRRPDSRRSTTQTWYFSSGMLTCGLPRLVVQVKRGVAGLYDGAEVVLGPDSGLEQPGPEQQFINQKMRPGSGVLSVQVLPDGPTRVLQHLMVTARRFTVIIEEKLLLKLLSFFGYGKAEAELERLEENLHERPSEDTGPRKRYYFENLKISLPQIKLSVLPSHKLPPDLKALKGTLGFPLIRFEDAVINMYPFTRVHPYETQEIIINDILKHFREELMSQAAQILGSVDFLGNPMGLLNDVTEGVSELIKYGNVGGLIRNVTHGVSNSAAKFAGTLSDGLGKTMDNRHQSEREYIRYHGATSGEHLVAGIHGLAHIIGGMTSIITSTVEGVKTEGGVSGFFSGLGKGLVGTVTKPVAGALDFASETAQTVRDIASLSNLTAQRVRKPRCCKGPQGLLPRYSATQAEGQEQLFRLTDNIHSEFIAVEPIDTYCVLISSKVVYFLKPGDYVDREGIFLEVKYDDLYHCLVSKDHGKVYVQLTKKAENTSSGVAIPGPSHQKPMVHVKSETLAVKISQEINYAKSLYYEQQLMLPADENEEFLLLEL
uniref:Vacuolar protein sorting 13 homolog D n=1 Tax=Fundulus heteroclitus TaxID=8078 RepID=A0A3Q2P4M1_FUNHE